MTGVVERGGADEADHALVARVLLTDDRRAFEKLMRRHQGTVRAQLRQLLRGDEARADELAQEAFLLAWRKLGQFRGEARFSTWLHRVAFTCFLQADRKRTPATRDMIDDRLEPHATPAESVELRVDVERAMGCLSEAEQIVLLHTVQIGLSHDEAAYVLAMPLGTVKSHATRGKAKLRGLLADWQTPSLEKGGS